MKLRMVSAFLFPLLAMTGMSASALADSGIRATGADSGVIYFQDDNYEGSFAYVCHNGCYTATLVNGYWERSVQGLSDGSVYPVTARIQDNETGQFESTVELSFSVSKTSGGSLAGDDSPDINTDVDTDTGVDAGSSVDSGLVYIVHKATGKKVSSCGPYDSQVEMESASATGSCVQWQQVKNGNFFYLHNVEVDGYIRPRGLSNGIPIKIHPTSSNGNYTLWSHEDTGDGYGYLVNRQTKKYAYTSGDLLEQESKNWKGDWTRWKFVPVMTDSTDTNTGSSTDTAADSQTDTDSDTGANSDTDTDTQMVTDGGDFCLTHDGNGNARVTHLDKPFRANYHYLCLSGRCYDASLVNGAWETPFNGLQEGQSYRVKTQLDDVAGECGITADLVYQVGGSCITSSCLPPDVDAPSIPAGLGGEQRNGRAVNLNWTASTDNRSVAGYEVYRGNNKVAFTTETTFSVTQLTPNTRYPFSVSACDGADNCSAKSEVINVETLDYIPDTTAPNVLPVVSGEHDGETAINVSWTEASDEHGVVKEYKVYRDDVLVSTTADLSFSDTGLEAAKEYTYGVIACDDSENCTTTAEAVLSTQFPDFSHLNWTYNKHDSTDVVLGISMANHNDNLIGPEPRANAPEYMATPNPGYAPTSHGFAFDINGSQLVWRWGPSIVKQSGDSGLEMSCSEDDGHTFKTVAVSGGTATIPCSEPYIYFFRYEHPTALNNNYASGYIYTGGFTTERRVDATGYTPFTDGSANWMRFRHPITSDGITAAVLDAQHNGDRLRHLDRYIVYVEDSPGNVAFNFGVNGNVIRNEAMRSHGGPNGQQFFAVNQNPGFGNAFSYGQVIQFEVSAIAGGSGAQTYNDFSYYTVGHGWGAYGDPRLNSAGKAGTTMWFSDGGSYTKLENNAIFTQPLATLHIEQDVDDWIVGHHLFHGVDPAKNGSSLFDDPDVQIGERTCGSSGCHFRDGRGSEAMETPNGPRIAPPVFGTGLLLQIEGREAGLAWNGEDHDMDTRVSHALEIDHKINPKHLPEEPFRLLVFYTEHLTVPNRDPGVYDSESVQRGDVLFTDIGCAECHTPVQKTRSDTEPKFRNLTLRPYTDMKVWDMGSVDAQGIEEGAFRTPPLWGLGHNLKLLKENGLDVLYMHDGRATTIDGAIQAHGGYADGSVTNYNALSGNDKQAIVDFVESL